MLGSAESEMVRLREAFKKFVALYS